MTFAANLNVEDDITIGERLKQIPLFAGLSDAQRERIAALCWRRGCRGRVCLFSSGDTDGQMFLVTRGGVKVYSEAKNSGRDSAGTLYTTGEVFGEMCLLTGAARSASAVTIAEKTELLILDRSSLLSLLRKDFALAQALLQSMALLLENTEQSAASAPDNACARMAKLLLARVEPLTGRLCPPLTQDEIARIIGTRRETVARNLAKLEGAGCLRRNRGDILIVSQDALQKAVSAT